MKKQRLILFALLLGLVVALILVSGCLPAPEGGEGEAATGLESYTMLIFVVLVIAMLYFITIRPQRKRQKEQQQMLSQLGSGAKVITASGIYGEIVSVSEDSVVLKVESGATIRVTKSSIVATRQRS